MNRPSIGFQPVEAEEGRGEDDDTIALLKKKPAPRAPVQQTEEVKTAAHAAGFRSRERRGLTGRNQQLNIKTTADAKERFYALADKLEVPLGKVFEEALLLIEKKHNC